MTKKGEERQKTPQFVLQSAAKKLLGILPARFGRHWEPESMIPVDSSFVGMTKEGGMTKKGEERQKTLRFVIQSDSEETTRNPPGQILKSFGTGEYDSGRFLLCRNDKRRRNDKGRVGITKNPVCPSERSEETTGM